MRERHVLHISDYFISNESLLPLWKTIVKLEFTFDIHNKMKFKNIHVIKMFSIDSHASYDITIIWSNNKNNIT